MLLATLAMLALPCFAQTDQRYKYFRVGNPADAMHVSPQAGYALMGGGTDLDEAFQWLCERAGGGDFLVLRATGTDAYNPYIQKLCPKLNSVATLVIPNREAAKDREVARRIAQASALFISGGDQANYINFWMGTPVQTAMNEAIARGVPLGGTSAGLAVMGEWAYSAQGDRPDDADLSGELAMSDPFGPRVTLVHAFLRIPALNGIISDTHFVRRERMERLLVFLARIREQDQKDTSQLPGWGPRGIGVEERVAVLLDPNGNALVVGHGAAYFINAGGASGVVVQGKPITYGAYWTERVSAGQAFNVQTWVGKALSYRLNMKDGVVTSSQKAGAIY